MARRFLYTLRRSTRKGSDGKGYFTISVPRHIGEKWEGRQFYYEVKPDETIVLIPFDGPRRADFQASGD